LSRRGRRVLTHRRRRQCQSWALTSSRSSRSSRQPGRRLARSRGRDAERRNRIRPEIRTRRLFGKPRHRKHWRNGRHFAQRRRNGRHQIIVKSIVGRHGRNCWFVIDRAAARAPGVRRRCRALRGVRVFSGLAGEDHKNGAPAKRAPVLLRWSLLPFRPWWQQNMPLPGGYWPIPGKLDAGKRGLVHAARFSCHYAMEMGPMGRMGPMGHPPKLKL